MQKTKNTTLITYSLRFYFYLLYLGDYFNKFGKLQTNRRGQKSPKVPVVPGTWEAGMYMFTVHTNATGLYIFCPSENK